MVNQSLVDVFGGSFAVGGEGGPKGSRGGGVGGEVRSKFGQRFFVGRFHELRRIIIVPIRV